MTIYAIYQIEDGRLVSSTNDATKIASSAILAARGYAVAQLDDALAGGIWNASTLTFDSPPAAQKYATADAIVAAFGPAKWAAAKALQDVRVTWLLDRMMMRREPIEITGQEFIGGMALLTGSGVLTHDESDAIVAALGG